MGKEEVELARMNLAAANLHFDGTLGGAERVLRARTELEHAQSKHGSELLSWLLSLPEQLDSFVHRSSELYEVRQAAAKFVMEKSWPDSEGWAWPVRIMESGWANGSVEDARSGAAISTPHYFPAEIVKQIAAAANGQRFRKRHPETGDGADAPELTVGWLSDAQMQGSAAVATVNLLKSDTEVRPVLLAARESGKLDLFGVSILAYFGFKKSVVDGREAMVASSLQKFVGLDFCAEPGAGGRFLSVAAG